MEKIIYQGAEAVISLKDNQIIKNRIKKSYRLNEIDEKLRKSRTRAEAKIIEKLNLIIPTPKIIKTDEKEKIIMQFIEGTKLSEKLEKLDYIKICRLIGDNIAKMHDKDIIHGDLTTSNMIYASKKESSKEESSCLYVYFIDFGLAFHSQRIEDKAVDLHLLKQALDAKHFTISEKCFEIILKNYNSKDKEKVFEQLKKVESRGRYKEKY